MGGKKKKHGKKKGKKKEAYSPGDKFYTMHGEQQQLWKKEDVDHKYHSSNANFDDIKVDEHGFELDRNTSQMIDLRDPLVIDGEEYFKLSIQEVH